MNQMKDNGIGFKIYALFWTERSSLLELSMLTHI